MLQIKHKAFMVNFRVKLPDIDCKAFFHDQSDTWNHLKCKRALHFMIKSVATTLVGVPWWLWPYT